MPGCSAQVTFYETDSSLRMTNLFTAAKDSTTGFSGKTCWISYTVDVPDAIPATFRCFSASFTGFSLA